CLSVPLLPDRGQLISSERNVDIPAGLEPGAAYDLALFEELGNPRRGVLVATVIMNFKFEDGVSALPRSKGQPLVWDALEKLNFMAGFKAAVESKWGEKHRITTIATTVPVTDVGVKFDIQPHERMSIFSHSHWNLTTTKFDPPPPGSGPAAISSVDRGGGGLFTNGEATLDSDDLRGIDKGG